MLWLVKNFIYLLSRQVSKQATSQRDLWLESYISYAEVELGMTFSDRTHAFCVDMRCRTRTRPPSSSADEVHPQETRGFGGQGIVNVYSKERI